MTMWSTCGSSTPRRRRPDMSARLYTTAEPTTKPMTARRDVRISVRSLDKVFGRGGAKVTAVDKVSFDIGRGEFVALLGPSGCGKSTILNMVAGLIPRSGGDILIDGRPMEHGQVRREIGYVFQRDTVFPW